MKSTENQKYQSKEDNMSCSTVKGIWNFILVFLHFQDTAIQSVPKAADNK